MLFQLFGIEFCTIPRNRGILESWESIPGFSRFFKHTEKPGKRGIFIPGSPCFSRLFGLAFHAFQETVESWKAGKLGIIHGFLRFFAHREKPGNRGIFIPGFPRFSRLFRLVSMLSKKPRNPGKLGIIPGFPRFFAHRGKPGKRGAFLPGFPGFPTLLGVTFLAFQETVESWKARKVRSPLAFHAFQDFLENVESQESPRFLGSQETPGFPGFSLCAKKRGKPGIFPRIPGISWLFFAGV